MIDIRESFGAKLLSALLGTVGLLLIITLIVVRIVTGQQVEAVTARTVENAGTAFEERNESRRAVVGQLARPFTVGNRALGALDVAISENDIDFLAGLVDYEMELQGRPDALLAFTDSDGTPVLSVIQGTQVPDGDPVNVAPIADELINGESMEVQSYRVIDGTMYDVRSLYLELGRRPIGTISFGLPIEAADVQAIGSVGGFEACLHFEGRCVVQTARVDDDLRDAMLGSIGLDEPLRLESSGTEWSIQSESLVPTDPSQGQRIVAVPLDAVLAPFDSIQRALFLGGGGALLLSILLGSILSRSLTRPVKALVAATGRVAEGDYETEVSVASRDEIGTLADAFNDMTRGLLVREQYRSVLNKVVSQDIAEELMKGDVELGGENRDITVLFADIRGFTPLTEGMEPQEVIGLLNDCMEHLAAAVDAEGGVVDKFIGDEVMAVFGAPVTQPDHARRAVTAAVRMRDGVTEMNRRRAALGEGAIGIGIGIASGVAVAGNMGSSDRMNYTVLGSIVNLAARLTGEAEAGEILIDRETRDAVGDSLAAPALGGRSLKGFSTEVEVYGVDMISYVPANSRGGEVAQRQPPAASSLALITSLGLASIAGGVLPDHLSAQWPTLAGSGVGYISESGTFQMDLSGQLDLEGLFFSNDEPGLSGLAYGEGALFAPRVRLFLDTFAGDHLYALVEWRGDRGEAPTADFWEARVEQAYLRVSTSSGALSVQGGIFASPFGSYAQRHLSVIDPFIRPPLLYDYRTVISRRWAPSNADRFVSWRDDPEQWREDGAPPVWGVPYQWGGMAKLGAGFLTFRLAAMNSAPSSEAEDWYAFETVEKVSLVGGVQAKVTPELTLGWSYNSGPYMRSDIGNGPDYAPDDGYTQSMWAADASFARGPVMLRGEFLHDSWYVPNLDDPAVDLGYTFEGQVDLAAGWSTALRYGRIDFREIGTSGEWDWDVTRWEAALGYRITLNAGIMASYAATSDPSPLDPEDNLFAIRLWWGF